MSGSRILVGVCEHGHSMSALWFAAGQALATGGEVVAVHVRPGSAAPTARAGAGGGAPDDAESRTFDRVRSVLARYKVRWRYTVRYGDKVGCLTDAALDLGAGTVVVGEDDRGPLGRLLRPSTARSLAGGPLPLVAVQGPPTGATVRCWRPGRLRPHRTVPLSPPRPARPGPIPLPREVDP